MFLLLEAQILMVFIPLLLAVVVPVVVHQVDKKEMTLYFPPLLQQVEDTAVEPQFKAAPEDRVVVQGGLDRVLERGI
ncbi:MAG: hypothetical protein EB119_08535, partial [Synechococcaceae bacterium WBB_34_004]|nr:hypothetical protein [Synechococcaceae bacterium WBB_34_004]